MYLLHAGSRVSATTRAVVAYCATAWDGPGAGLAELRRDCRDYAARHRLRIVAWATEVVPDDAAARQTETLTWALVEARYCAGMLVAESRTLPRTTGVVHSLDPTGVTWLVRAAA